MPDTTPNLTLPYILQSQAQKHVTHNEALSVLDALVQLTVESATLTTPPAAPSEGARFVVAGSATDAWAGHDGEIAVFDGVAWMFYPPQVGWRCWDQAQSQHLVFDGQGWTEITNRSLQNLEMLGIGTTATATQPFQARLNQTLWTALQVAEGGMAI